jgi:hypothetical protein
MAQDAVIISAAAVARRVRSFMGSIHGQNDRRRTALSDTMFIPRWFFKQRDV